MRRVRAVPGPVYEAVLEHVRCFLCGADDYEVIYAARLLLNNIPNLSRMFRASSDERRIPPLVRCRACGFQYVTPRPHWNVMLSAYAEGDDPAYLGQLRGRERSFVRIVAEGDRAEEDRNRRESRRNPTDVPSRVAPLLSRAPA